jgi:putative chitinase
MDKTLIENLGNYTSNYTRQFINSLDSTFESKSSMTSDLKTLLEIATQKPYRTSPILNSVSYSGIRQPLDQSPGRLMGYSRNWGHASSNTQQEVMQKILQYSSDLSTEDQAILLGIARIESGFNPDAATPSTSASGVFQIIKSTGENLGLKKEDRFNADLNIKAGVKLFKENLSLAKKRWPNLTGDERAKMLYALHHDGPSLKFGGSKIASDKLLPYLAQFRQIAELSKQG